MHFHKFCIMCRIVLVKFFKRKQLHVRNAVTLGQQNLKRMLRMAGGGGGGGSDLNGQLTLSGEKVNMSMAPSLTHILSCRH